MRPNRRQLLPRYAPRFSSSSHLTGVAHHFSRSLNRRTPSSRLQGEHPAPPNATPSPSRRHLYVLQRIEKRARCTVPLEPEISSLLRRETRNPNGLTTLSSRAAVEVENYLLIHIDSRSKQQTYLQTYLTHLIGLDCPVLPDTALKAALASKRGKMPPGRLFVDMADMPR